MHEKIHPALSIWWNLNIVRHTVVQGVPGSKCSGLQYDRQIQITFHDDGIARLKWKSGVLLSFHIK